MFYINLELFGGRSGSSGMGGGGKYSDVKGAGYDGNFIPEDEQDAIRLQNLIELRERWGRAIGSNNPNDHLISSYKIIEINKGKVNEETFIGTKMQFNDKLNTMQEAHGRDIRSNSNSYSVTGWEDRRRGGNVLEDAQTIDKEFNGQEMRKIWRKAKIPY